MGTLYVATTGNAANSGSTDQDAANLSGSAATAAGAVISLDGSPDLSTLVTSGATQSTINITGATNSNQTIFWITAVDNSASKTVTVTPTPTGMTSNAWRIGGRHVLTNARIEAALRAGDTVIFNDSPAAQATTLWTSRAAGDSTSGFAKLKGKTGTRPVLSTSGVNIHAITTTHASFWVENLELKSTAGSGTGSCISMTGSNSVIKNVKMSQSRNHGVFLQTGNNLRVQDSEIVGGSILTDGINYNGTGPILIENCYIHDCPGDSIELSGNSVNATILFNILDTPAAKNLNVSGAAANQNTLIVVRGNTIYGAGSDGLFNADADQCWSIRNNVFKDNGNAGGESNVNFSAGTAELLSDHSNNIFHNTSGADAPINLTLDGTELTTDPLMGNPASGDFTIGSTSPAKGAGVPGVLGINGGTGYMDIGALQITAASSGGIGFGDGMSGGFAG